jgi:hypothetical protein
MLPGSSQTRDEEMAPIAAVGRWLIDGGGHVKARHEPPATQRVQGKR